MVGFILTLLLAVPDRGGDAPAVPQVAGKCQYGEVHQKGAKVAIVGDRMWQATGEWNGVVLSVNWLCIKSGWHAYAEYELTDGNLVGWWAWSDDVATDEHGNMRIIDSKDETLYLKR